LGGTDGGGDFVQERAKFGQLVSVDTEAAQPVDKDLGPSPVVRLADLRLPYLDYVATRGLG